MHEKTGSISWKKIYTAELISSPVQVHQSEDSVQEQPTEPNSPFHPQLIQIEFAIHSE
jgi:hypothetical protein